MSTYITKRARELGLRKVDARSPLQLEVQPQDIAKADLKNPQSCAFARACKRSKKAKAAHFFRTAAWLEYDNKLVRYMLPTSMQKEIVAFDRNRTMEPGLYQLSAPCKSTRMSEVKKRSAKRPGRHQPGGIRRSSQRPGRGLAPAQSPAGDLARPPGGVPPHGREASGPEHRGGLPPDVAGLVRGLGRSAAFIGLISRGHRRIWDSGCYGACGKYRKRPAPPTPPASRARPGPFAPAQSRSPPPPSSKCPPPSSTLQSRVPGAV